MGAAGDFSEECSQAKNIDRLVVLRVFRKQDCSIDLKISNWPSVLSQKVLCKAEVLQNKAKLACFLKKKTMFGYSHRKISMYQCLSKYSNMASHKNYIKIRYMHIYRVKAYALPLLHLKIKVIVEIQVQNLVIC